MGLILSSQITEDDDPVGVPLIGYHNVLTTGNITSTTAETGFPISNVANPATHLKWKSGVNTGLEVLTILPESEVDYMAVAGHNWGSLGLSLYINSTSGSQATSLLHFEVGDSPVAFVDSAPTPHVWLPVGNATISSANSKFGSASGLFDGTGDYLTGDGSADFAFGTGDFTIDFWYRPAVSGTEHQLYDGRPAATNGAYPTLYKTTGNVIVYLANGGNQINGTTVLASGTWYHVALTRSGTSTRLFVNGIQEGSTYSDSTNYLNPANRPIIGAGGNSLGAASINGNLDELRILREAAWTTTFTLPSTAYLNNIQIIETTAITNDDPIIFRFPLHFTSSIRIALSSAISQPEAAVIYVGQLLVLERSITIGRGHVPITYGRRTNVINGMSESGNFLGRIVLGSYLESKAEFEWFTPEFYRSDIDDFLDAAREVPFFWAWSPTEYPDEVGYVWLTNNAEPEIDPVTRRVALELQMRGIA